MNARCDTCTRPLANRNATRATCSACTPAPAGKYPERSLALKQPLVRHGLIYRQETHS